nr:MerR family transcriptional regulator [Rhodospirillaceae bacterium]
MAADTPTTKISKKAPGAFRTISEVADTLDLPQHVLRFWETKFKQIRPMKRGGGRRYYRPEDVALLRRIQSLLYDEGYTIKGVQKLLRDGALKKADLPEETSVAKNDDLDSEVKSAIDELENLRAELTAAR